MITARIAFVAAALGIGIIALSGSSGSYSGNDSSLTDERFPRASLPLSIGSSLAYHTRAPNKIPREPLPTGKASPTVTPSPIATPSPTPVAPAPTPAPDPPSSSPSRVSEENGFAVIIPIYNKRGLEVATTTLRPYIRPGDVFLVISGNFRPINVSWLNQSAVTLKSEYPNTIIMAGTSGLGNVSPLAEGAAWPIEAIVYIYEPDFPNEPEFTWDFNTTIANFKGVAQAARARGLGIVGKPTGRPLLQASLQKYGWDYGILSQHVDQMFIQTQTYCKKGVDVYAQAIDELLTQYAGVGASGTWFPQVTVDPKAPNGVPVSRAIECVNAAQARGIPGVMMWWSPSYPDQAVEFLRLLGR